MVGGLPGNAFVLMEFKERGGVSELAFFVLEALILDARSLSSVVWNWRERRVLCRPRQASAGTRDSGLGTWAKRSASRIGMRRRRQKMSASSWTSWVSVGVPSLYSSTNWRQW